MLHRWIWVVVSLIGGLLATALLDHQRGQILEAETLQQLRPLAASRLDSQAAALQRALGTVELLTALFNANPEPNPREFNRFAASLQRVPGVASVLVAEAVPAAKRSEAEARWRAVYPDFTLRVRSPAGQLVSAPPRAEYWPVVYGTFGFPGRLVMGYDLSSDRQLQGSLVQARTRPMLLAPPLRGQAGEVGALAIAVRTNGATTRAYIIGVLPAGLVLADPHPLLRDYWYDVADPSRDEQLFPAELDNAGLPPWVLGRREVKVAGRAWRLESRLESQVLAERTQSGRTLTWTAGVLVTMLVSFLVAWLVQRFEQESEDDQRFRIEVQQLNEVLSREQTARRDAEREATQLMTILDTANEAVVMIGERGRIELFNAAAERLFAYRADEVLGSNVTVLMPSSYRTRHNEAIAQYVRTGRSRSMGQSRELLAQKKGGAAFPIELSLNEFREGDRRYFVGVIRDITDRKRTERMLFESEYKHRAILDAAYIGIYVHQDGRLRFVNPTFAAYFGKNPAHMVERQTLQELVVPDWRPALDLALDVEQSGGRPTELMMQRPDGTRFYALFTAKPIIFDNRPGLAGSLLDISERKAAEQAMLKAEIKNLAILEAIPDLMLQIDANGHVVDCRARAGATEFGLPPDSVGHPYKRVLPPPFAEQLTATLAQPLRSRSRSFEYQLTTGDGSCTRHFEARLSPTSEGESLIMVRDITDRKVIEAELIQHRDHLADLVRERTAELNSLFTASPMATAFVTQRRFVDVNDAFVKLFGHERGACINAPVRLLFFNDEDFESVQTEVYPQLGRGELVRMERRYLRADGQPVLCEAFGKAIDPADPMAGSVWVYQDIEDRRAAETALKAAKELAEAANRAKSEFLANMSHELRTPMHAVLSFAELGESKVGGDPAKLAHYFARIRQSGQRLLQMLNDLLDLSKLEAGKMVYTLQPLSLSKVLGDLKDELSQLAATKRVRLELEASPGLPEVAGDSFRLAQVFQNLIANAIKFSPEGGVVRIRFAWDDTQVVASVEDEGIGVPPDEVESIFDKFIQSSKTKTGAGGTGLGLAICREIIAAHGGQIRCENRSEGGARFLFTLPRPGVSLAAPSSQ